MAVDDHGLEVLKKAGEEVTPGSKADYFIKTGEAQGSVLDSNNSTVATLAGDAVFTGTATEVIGYASIAITIYADEDSATDGMCFQFSTDGTNWDENNCFNMIGGITRRFQFPVTARYFRIQYTNGSTIQAVFRVQTILHKSNILTSIHRIDGALINDRSVTVTKSIIAGETTGGGGGFVNVKVNPSGSLAVESTISDLNGLGEAQQVDSVGSITYVGAAAVGSATSGALWKIARITCTGADVAVEWADSDQSYDNIWDNRLSLTYG